MVDHHNLRDTQISWIGQIPAHWELKKIKYVFWERKENNNPIQTENLISLTIERGVIPHSEKTGGGNKPKDDLTKYKIVRPGDIVLNSMNVIAGAVGISKYFGIVSPVYYMLIPVDQDSTKEYFHHLFRTEPFEKSLYGLGNGILIKENEETGKLNTIRMRIPMDKLGDQLIPVPPVNEQRLISRYLDKKTVQIDSLIKKIEKKIELLKEQRTSLINQFVTKGLDPNVELKDSGIEWIGKIPKHWKVQKLKYLVTYNTETLDENTDPNYEFHYIEIGDVDYLEGVNISPKINFSESPSRARRVVRPKDVIISTVRTYLRAIGVVPEVDDVICSTGFCVLRDQSGCLDQDFLSFTVKSEWFISEVIGNSYGVSYPAINSSELAELKITLPPLDEQKAIVDYLQVNISKFERSIQLEVKRKTLLSEYRQSLISSVVTGKIRVTEEMV